MPSLDAAVNGLKYTSVDAVGRQFRNLNLKVKDVGPAVGVALARSETSGLRLAHGILASAPNATRGLNEGRALIGLASAAGSLSAVLIGAAIPWVVLWLLEGAARARLLGLGLVGLLLALWQLGTFVRALISIRDTRLRLFILAVLIPVIANSITEFGIFGPMNYAVTFYQLLLMAVVMVPVELTLRMRLSN